MEVVVQENFYKKLKKLPKDVQIRTYDALKLLERFPFIRLDIKKLKGKERIFRIRLGKYRIIFILIENKIYVSDIGARSRVEYR
jgi:mRNA interferase RelE/StbE